MIEPRTEWGFIFLCAYPLVALAIGMMVLLDGSRIRINGGVGWSFAAAIAWPIAVPAYFHFRRIHMRRLQALAAASGKEAPLPLAPLAPTRADTIRIALGMLLLLVGGVVVIAIAMPRTGAAIALAGVALAGDAARRISRRSL